MFSVLVIRDRKSGSAGMPRPIPYAVFCLKKKNRCRSTAFERRPHADAGGRGRSGGGRQRHSQGRIQRSTARLGNQCRGQPVLHRVLGGAASLAVERRFASISDLEGSALSSHVGGRAAAR